LQPPSDVQQVAGGLRQPVKARHHDHVAGAKVIEHPRQLGTVGAGAGDLLGKDALAAAGCQQLALG